MTKASKPGAGSKSKLVQLEARKAPASEPAVPTREKALHPLYGVAMLKIAMELKKPGTGEVEEVIASVLNKMRLSESDFRQFLQQNGGLLRAIASSKGR
jgi:hypothetical protein